MTTATDQPIATGIDGRLRVAQGVGLFCTIAAAAYTLADASPSPPAALFFQLAPSLSVILWLQRDTHRTGVGAVFDLGLLLWYTTPLFVPWYAWKTRGWRGWRLAVLLYLLMISPNVGSAFASLLLTSR